jgi:probable 2-oxoglutarate dehydrogenase E1 component DHKTD1
LVPHEPVLNLEGIVYFNDVNIRTISNLEDQLKARYCSNISAEFEYIEDEFEREWFASNYEKIAFEKLLINDIDKREIAELLIKCQTWDQFLATKFPTVKRYGGEGYFNI